MKRIITIVALGALISAVPAQASIWANAQALASKALARVKQHPYITSITATALLCAGSIKCNNDAKKLEQQIKILNKAQAQVMQNGAVDFNDFDLNIKPSDLPYGKKLHEAVINYQKSGKSNNSEIVGKRSKELITIKQQNRTELFTLINKIKAVLENRQKTAMGWGFVGRWLDAAKAKFTHVDA